MKIGILDIDCHASKKKWGATIYPNLALCKIAAYHKAQGDSVEWATPFEEYDILYMSKIFNFSEDDRRVYHAKKIIKGGTGYDIDSKLPDEIDRLHPDYSIYPHIPEDTAYGFLTRGCPNKCKWCVVPQKEGKIHAYADIDWVANGRKKVILMDNNILAAGDYAMKQLQKIIDRGYIVDFNQALDARLVTQENAKLLAQIKWLERRIRFGCDQKAQIAECERAMNLIDRFGFKWQYFLYTMLDGDFHECFDRIGHWWYKNQELREKHTTRRVYPYAQPYRDPINPNHKIPQWQKDMAGWCNKKMLFESIPFVEFEPRKGFCCGQYFSNPDLLSL